MLVVGDLAGLRFAPTLRIAAAIGRARAIAIAGNHDGPNPAQLLAEVAGQPGVADRFTRSLITRYDAFAAAVTGGGAVLGGYDCHNVGPPDDRVSVVVGRPLSLGGPRLTFAGFLAARFGIASMQQSAQRLCDAVDAAEAERIVFLAHNGPTGLGASRSDIWGCDFRAAEGDWGDPDLEVAVRHAQRSGRRVLAVVAGHMHRALRGGGERIARVERDGVVYVNAAQVPRITRSGRHHVRLEIDGDAVQATDVWVPA